MLTPLPGAIETAPGSCTVPFFGVDAAILDERGVEVPSNSGGLLAIRQPWPAMLRGIFGDRERYIETYWSKFEVEDNGADRNCPSPYYFAGDGARRDENGYFWIMGRVDDVINVAGHRLGTMEIESALVSSELVAEAAVVGFPHEIGAIAKPDQIRFTDALPKTRSGKIMRRLLRDIAAGIETTGDTTTLEDFSVLAKLRGDGDED